MRLVPTVSEHEELLAKAMKGLEDITPKNEYGFPLGIYRPDMLPMHDYRPDEESIQDLYTSLPSQTHFTSFRPAEDPAAGHIEDIDIDEGDEGDGFSYVEFLEGADGVSVGELETSAFPVPQLPDRVAGFPRKELAAAYIPLHYEEGFPTLPDGQPYWDQFIFEPADAYIAFQAYLAMPAVCAGVRSLVDLPAVMVQNELLDGDEYTHREFTAKFKNYMQIYGWALRARAYDLYRAAAYRKQMEYRAIETQDSHYATSNRLMGKLLRYMESDEDFWDMLTPKVGIDMFKTLTQVQRISAGLPASAPPSVAADDKGGESFEMILRTLAMKGQAETQVASGGDSRLTARILENPETTQIAQELIIRLGNKQQ